MSTTPENLASKQAEKIKIQKINQKLKALIDTSNFNNFNVEELGNAFDDLFEADVQLELLTNTIIKGSINAIFERFKWEIPNVLKWDQFRIICFVNSVTHILRNLLRYDCYRKQNCSKFLLEWNSKYTENPIRIITWEPVKKCEYFYGFASELRTETESQNDITTISIKPFPLGSEQRILRHCTGIQNFIDILKNADWSMQDPVLTFKGKISTKQYVCHAGGLIYTTLQLRKEELKRLKRKKFVTQNRYGSMVLTFPVPLPKAVWNLGTRVYRFERSQVLLCDNYKNKQKWTLISKERVNDLVEIQNLEDYEWKLDYHLNGQWTHPEIAFPGELVVPLSRCEIDIQMHNCIKECNECRLPIQKLVQKLKTSLSELESNTKALNYMKDFLYKFESTNDTSTQNTTVLNSGFSTESTPKLDETLKFKKLTTTGSSQDNPAGTNLIGQAAIKKHSIYKYINSRKKPSYEIFAKHPCHICKRTNHWAYKCPKNPKRKMKPSADTYAKNPCHICKKIGHWRKECPQNPDKATLRKASKVNSKNAGLPFGSSFTTVRPESIIIEFQLQLGNEISPMVDILFVKRTPLTKQIKEIVLRDRGLQDSIVNSMALQNDMLVNAKLVYDPVALNSYIKIDQFNFKYHIKDPDILSLVRKLVIV